MDIVKRRASSRLSLYINETRFVSTEPLHSHVSEVSLPSLPPLEVPAFIDKRDSLRNRPVLITRPSTKPIKLAAKSQRSLACLRAASAKSIERNKLATESIYDRKQILQIVMQQAVDQLTLISSKTSSKISKLYTYQTPEQRFNKKPVYHLEFEKVAKTQEDKMLKIQGMIREKINDVFVFLHNIMKDTSDELRIQKKYTTLISAIESIKKTEQDNKETLATKNEQKYLSLFRDIKRIEKEMDKLKESNRATLFGYLTAKDQLIFINMKKIDYVEKWEAAREWLNDYSKTKACRDVKDYIRSINDKILKEQNISFQTTKFLIISIRELQKKRDQYPDLLNREIEKRTRENDCLRDHLDDIKIAKNELRKEIEKRREEMADWILYKETTAIEAAILAKIAEEEEAARREEEDRRAAERALEEQYIASLTDEERAKYLKNKRKQKKAAAKAAARAEKLAREKAALKAKKKAQSVEARRLA